MRKPKSKPVQKLSRSMSVEQFRNGYWYALELKRFARDLGIVATSRLRKDELELAIEHFLRTGTVPRPPKRDLSALPKERDVHRGLRLDLPIVAYTNDRETKAFLEREARKLNPSHKRRSGARYRLNRWREGQITKGVRITYRDLVDQYVRLCQSPTPFARVPQVRYINFLADFLEDRPGASREEAIAAWGVIKTLDMPKTYEAWRASRSRR
jgi:hypothetical protein